MATELLEKRPTIAPIVYFLSHLFASTCFGCHSIVIRVLDIKKCNKLQRVYPFKVQFLKCVIQF